MKAGAGSSATGSSCVVIVICENDPQQEGERSMSHNGVIKLRTELWKPRNSPARVWRRMTLFKTGTKGTEACPCHSWYFTAPPEPRLLYQVDWGVGVGKGKREGYGPEVGFWVPARNVVGPTPGDPQARGDGGGA